MKKDITLQKIIELAKQGKTQDEIANEFPGCSAHVHYLIMREWRRANGLIRQRKGSKPKLTVSKQPIPEVKKVPGQLRHKFFETALRCVLARTASGLTVPNWWFGAPGAGKTKLGSQIAEAIGVPFYPLSCGPTTTEGRLLGYRNLATGDFVPGHIYKPFKDGGVCLIDEADVADPGVLVACNSISANDAYMFPNGEYVPRHKDFYLVATANTVGTGAANGFTRNKLDAATLDRFAMIKLEYDETMEAHLSGNREWCEYVWKVRKFVEKSSDKAFYVTPRASMNGAAMLAQGLPAKFVVECVILNKASKTLAETIVSNCGMFEDKSQNTVAQPVI